MPKCRLDLPIWYDDGDIPDWFTGVVFWEIPSMGRGSSAFWRPGQVLAQSHAWSYFVAGSTVTALMPHLPNNRVATLFRLAYPWYCIDDPIRPAARPWIDVVKQRGLYDPVGVLALTLAYEIDDLISKRDFWYRVSPYLRREWKYKVSSYVRRAIRWEQTLTDPLAVWDIHPYLDYRGIKPIRRVMPDQTWIDLVYERRKSVAARHGK